MRVASRLPHQDRVGLQLDVELQRAGIRQQLEEVLAQQQLAAAEREEQRAGGGELIEDVLDFRRGHLAVVVVIQVAVDAALVAPVGEIEVHRQRNAGVERPIPHVLHEIGH